MDFFWLSESIRHTRGRTLESGDHFNNWGNHPRYAFFDQDFVKFFHYDSEITNLADFRYRYFLHPYDASRGLSGDAIVYATDDGFYGLYYLVRPGAPRYWRRLDAMNASELASFRISHWRTHEDLGTFAALSVRAQALRHRVDRDYYRGRDLFRQEADRANSTMVEINGVERITFNWFMNEMAGLEQVRRYIRGELDRETEGNSGDFFDVIENREYLASYVGAIALEQVTNIAQPIAITMVFGMIDLVDSFGGDEERVRRLLLSYPSLQRDLQLQLLAAHGIEEGEQEAMRQTLVDVSSTLDIYRGLEVNGVSIARITRSVQQTHVQLETVLSQFRSWEIAALMVEGEFGNAVRDQTYERLHFRRLRGDTFPHDEETEGVFPEPLSGDASQYGNLLEQMYANELNARITTNRILIVTAIVVVTVVLILISMGVGAYIAGAAGVAGTFWETGISATVLTLMQEGLAQALGAGALTSEEDDFGLSELAGNFALNVVMFRFFGALGNALRGASSLVRLPAMFSTFFAISYCSHLATHGGEIPSLGETGFILYESALMFAMLEVGGFFARPLIRQLQVSGSSARVAVLNQRLTALQGQADALRLQFNAEYEADAPDTDARIDLATRYLDLMTRQQQVLENIRDTEGVEKEVDIDAEIRRLHDHMRSVREARCLLISRLQPIEGSNQLYTYDPATRSVSAIQEQYGAENVSGPDANGIIRVSYYGSELVLYPTRASTSGTSTLQGTVSGRPGTRVDCRRRHCGRGARVCRPA